MQQSERPLNEVISSTVYIIKNFSNAFLFEPTVNAKLFYFVFL